MCFYQEHIWLNISHFPWPMDPICRKYSVRFAESKTLPVRARPLQLFLFSNYCLDCWSGQLPKLRKYLAKISSGRNNRCCIFINSHHNLLTMPGYYTGSMYNDIMLRKKGFYGEGVSTRDGLVVTVKTHGHTTEKGAHVARPEQVSYFVLNS